MWYLRLHLEERERKEALDMRELTLDIIIRKFSSIYFVIKILIKVLKGKLYNSGRYECSRHLHLTHLRLTID